MRYHLRLVACNSLSRSQLSPFIGRRHLQISAISPTTLDTLTSELPSKSTGTTPDARFEILGAPYPLLSVSLSASQNLYTRRGTVVGVDGNAENVTSTLSLIKPFRRAALGIPFLYQKISSTSPVTALLSTSSSLAVVQMDGSTDWKIFGNALLSWTGQTLSIKPAIGWGKSLEHLSTSEVTGRGLLAVVGQGSVYEVILKSMEEYVVHPSNVIAYTINSTPPSQYRLKSSTFRLQVPNVNIGKIFPDTKFFKVMRETWTWKTIGQIFFNLRLWLRRTIWGDRSFLRFYGPTTILLQSRPSRLSDILTSREVNQIADAPPGAVTTAIRHSETESLKSKLVRRDGISPATIQTTYMGVANVGQDGKVKFSK